MSEISMARFAQLVGGPDERLALDEGALLIAAVDHAVEVPARLTELDALAQACPEISPDGLVRYLFRAQGFAGNRGDYYDPANSFLDAVLDRRLGIPITLSVLAIEVGRRLGLAIEGLNTPGHFLIRSGETVFDPFEGGRVVEELTGVDLPVAGPRLVLARMLANLKHVQVARGDVIALRRVLQLRVSMPDATDDERAQLRRLEAGLN